jgi:2Fe-2S ferredoxin
MPIITYVDFDGTRTDVNVELEMNVMEGATLNMVSNIEGQCGGICSCATCHCYIEAPWSDKIPEKQSGEVKMLEKATHLKSTSRLGCQVVITPELEGMVVYLPESQG